jgi:hypothetical protein
MYYSRLFEGEVVSIGLADGGSLTVTPNHPILTQRGWIAAGEVIQGDHVVKAINPAALVELIDPNHNDMETRVEYLADPAMMPLSSASFRVPTTPKAFHGDRSVNDEVRVIFSNRYLSLNRYSDFGKALKDLRLGNGHRARVGLPVKGALALLRKGLFAALSRLMGRLGAGLNRGLAETAHVNGASLGATADWKAEAMEAVAKRCGMASEGSPKFDGAFSSHVAFVQVTNIVRAEYSGHVYNLQTENGWYTANGIITHNCACDIEYEVEAEEDHEDIQPEKLDGRA